MSVLGVAQAAEELGVSERRVRQMLADGVLAGERVGRVWVIDASQLPAVERLRRQVGRPWSASSAWGVLALADGKDPGLSPVEKSRARKRLGNGLEGIVGRLAARAEVQRFYAHPGVLDRLARADEVVLGGASAAAEYDVDLLARDGVEAYVRFSDRDALVSRFALDRDAERPNVVMRIVDDEAWPFDKGQRVADRAIVAVDLLESDDARSRRSGAELARRS